MAGPLHYKYTGRMLRALVFALCFAAGPARAQVVAPHAIEIPAWVRPSFPDLAGDAP